MVDFSGSYRLLTGKAADMTSNAAARTEAGGTKIFTHSRVRAVIINQLIS